MESCKSSHVCFLLSISKLGKYKWGWRERDRGEIIGARQDGAEKDPPKGVLES